MARFAQDPRNDKRGTQDGFKYQDHTNLGHMYAKIAGQWLYKRVVTLTGRVLNYKPTKATRKEKKLYG